MRPTTLGLLPVLSSQSVACGRRLSESNVGHQLSKPALEKTPESAHLVYVNALTVSVPLLVAKGDVSHSLLVTIIK